MKHIFSVRQGFPVPDGTIVHPVLDPSVLSDAPAQHDDALSLAVGHVPPHTSSRIHVHPLVTQVTWLLSGRLVVKMKDAVEATPYTLQLAPEHAVLTRPGTFFQLINSTDHACRVLYIVTPAFLFECDDDGNVLYNDAVVLEQDWDELAAADWQVPALADIEGIRKRRRQARNHLVRRNERGAVPKATLSTRTYGA